MRDIARTFAVIGVTAGFIAAAPAQAADDPHKNFENNKIYQWMDGRLPYDGPKITYDGPPITVRYSTFLGAGSAVIAENWQVAAKRMEADTGGKMKFRIFWGNTLHDSQRGAFEGVSGGVSDMSHCYSWINPGGFDLQLGIQLPGMVDNWDQKGATTAANAMTLLYPEFFKKRYEAHNVLFAAFSMTPPQQTLTKDRPIHKIEDMAGRKMLASGDIATATARALGALPVPLTVAEYYSGFQTGVVDIFAIHDAGLVLFRMVDLAKFRTTTNLWANPIEFCQNKDFYAKLPADLREYWRVWTARWNHTTNEVYFDRSAGTAVQRAIDTGMKMHALSDAEKARVDAALKPVVDEWIAGMEAKGLPARKMVDSFKAKVAELRAMTYDQIFDLASKPAIALFE
ncbi:MAG: TRAP transporter substrate-binding protein DctP [Alphaproteobacteria bacterium]